MKSQSKIISGLNWNATSHLGFQLSRLHSRPQTRCSNTIKLSERKDNKKKRGKRKKSWFRIIPPWRVSNVSESLAFAGTLAQAARVSASTTTDGSERDRDGGPQNKLRHVCRAIKYMSGKSRRRYRLVRTRLWWHTGEEGKEKREQWNGWV